MFLFTRSFFLFLLLFACGIASAQTADFTAAPPSGCAPLPVGFTNTSTGTTSSTTYEWDFGNFITSTLKDGSTTYLTAGTYTVKLTITEGSKKNTKTMTITVYPAPKASYTASPTS